MKKMISFLLTLTLLISFGPITALQAEAVQTWYAPVVRQVMNEYGYEWSKEYEKVYWRGALQDVDRDGFEELVLVFKERGMNDYSHCQVWDIQNGNIVCVMEQKIYGSYGGLAVFFFEIDGTEYLVIESSSTGTVGTSYHWQCYDSLHGYEKSLDFGYDYYEKSFFFYDNNTFEEVYFTGAKAYDICTGLMENPPLAGNSYFSDISGRSFDELANAEIFSQLIAYSQNQDMSILEGDTLTIRYVLYESGEIVTDWEKPAVSVGDGSILKAVEWEQTYDGYLLTVQGLNSGETSLTVTDGKSKAFVSLCVTVRDGDAEPCTYTIFDVPTGYLEIWGDSKTQTNFYGFNGLYVNSYTCKPLTNGKYPVSFTVYNHSKMYGSVDIYDKNGNWVGAERIDKYQDPTSIYEVGSDAWFLVKDLVTKNALSYTANSFSRKTEISVCIPEGGYITISNNFQESPGTYLYNAVDLLMMGANAVASLVIDVTQVEQVQDQIIHMVMENEAFTKAFINEFQKIAQNTIQEMTYDGIANSIGAVTVHANEFFEVLDLDFWGTVSSVCGIAEDIFLQCTMAEVTIAFKGLFALNKYINVVCQTEEILTSGDEPGILLTSAHAYMDTVTISGVKVTPDSGALPHDAVMKVFRVADRDTLTIPELEVDTNTFLLYNICYTVDNKKIQPEKAVTIQIPIPENFQEGKCIILHQLEDKSWEQIPSHAENGFIVFRADKFSLFALVESTSEHNYIQTVTPPGCTSMGFTTHICTICGHSYVDTYVEAQGHMVTRVDAVDPTHKQPGNREYYACVCGMWFEDANMTIEISDYSSVSIPERALLYGDANHDGKLNVTDAVMVMKHRASTLSEEEVFCEYCANVDGKESINISDAVLIIKKRANPSFMFPVTSYLY